MKITVCIGSSCHLKGSREIVEQLQALIAENNLKDQIELAGTFCMGNCMNGVNVTIGDEIFSLKPETTKPFFDKQVLPRLKEELASKSKVEVQ
jgi:NADH:ubiquinone oxidoreductase subunit E